MRPSLAMLNARRPLTTQSYRALTKLSAWQQV